MKILITAIILMLLSGCSTAGWIVQKTFECELRGIEDCSYVIIKGKF